MQECCDYSGNRDGVVCRRNGKACKPISRITVEALIRHEHRGLLTSMSYDFCDAPDCDVVYVPASGKQQITKNLLRVRVDVKETEDPIPLCYCFGFDKKAIWDELVAKGTTDIPRKSLTESRPVNVVARLPIREGIVA